MLNKMRKFIVKHFALDYITKAFGYTINFVRPATIIFPLFVLNGIITIKYDYPTWQIIFLIPLVISLFLGFLYFRFFPVKWRELDMEQLFQYQSAIKRNVIRQEVTPDMVNAFNKASMYVKSNIKDKRFYKPFRFIFHPLIMVALSILLTVVIMF